MDEVKLEDNERQKCEIWTRVMGYHRPVQSFNVGKKGEFAERLATNGGKGWTRLSYNGQTLYAVSSMLITAEEYNRSQNSAAED